MGRRGCRFLRTVEGLVKTATNFYFGSVLHYWLEKCLNKRLNLFQTDVECWLLITEQVKSQADTPALAKNSKGCRKGLCPSHFKSIEILQKLVLMHLSR